MSKAEVQKPYYYDFNEDIDLRELALVIFRRWKVIAALVVLVAAGVVAVNAYVLTPSYESSSVVFYSNTNAALDVGFDTFEALAASPAVMSRVIRETRADVSVAELSRRFSFNTDNGSPLMTVSVRADDPYLAKRLVESWINAVRSETHRFMESRLADRKAVVEANYLSQREALVRAEDALVHFDRESSLDVLEAGLLRDVEQLVADEQLYESLRDSIIPTDEATAQTLKDALIEEQTTNGSGLFAETQAIGEMRYVAVNPTYLEIRQRLTDIESSLAANRRRVEILRESLPQLRARVNETNAALTDLKIQRDRLERDVTEARSLFEAARIEREQILALERQLPNATRIDVVAEPVFSDRPVSPRKMLNLAIGIMLALMVGVFGVLVAAWWRGEGGRSTAR